MSEVPYGYCHCGCGEKAPLSDRTHAALGLVRGEPRRFIKKHRPRTNTWEERDCGSGSPCWVWTGTMHRAGYGQAHLPHGEHMLAHRWIWGQRLGPIPGGYQLHHRCENPPCVNPAHLELVTHAEHRRLHLKSHCRHGHPYTPENTSIRTDGSRRCLTCHRNQERARQEAQRVG